MNTQAAIPAEIFKAYDIRGIVDRTLTESGVETIGRGLGTLAARKGVKKFVIGRDGRLSGPRLAPPAFLDLDLDAAFLFPLRSLPISDPRSRRREPARQRSANKSSRSRHRSTSSTRGKCISAGLPCTRTGLGVGKDDANPVPAEVDKPINSETVFDDGAGNDNDLEPGVTNR